MSIYSDLDDNYDMQTDGDIKKDEDVAAIINSIMNIVQTIPGDRRMLPTFAYGGYHVLFEPMDKHTAERLGHHLIESIERWDDRVKVTQMRVTADYDKNQYDVTCSFLVEGFGPSENIQQIDFILKKL